MVTILVLVETPAGAAKPFCAGLEFDLESTKVLRAAPILRWAVGREMPDVLHRIEQNGWRATTAKVLRHDR